MMMSTPTKTPTDRVGTYRKYKIKEKNIPALKKFVEKLEKENE